MNTVPLQAAIGVEKKFSPGEKHPNNNKIRNIHHVHDVNSDPQDKVPFKDTRKGIDAIRLIEDAINRCKDEPALLASSDFFSAVRLVRERDPATWAAQRVKLRRVKPRGVLLSDIDKASQPLGEAHGAAGIADGLVALVRERADLWHAEDGACFASLTEPPCKTFRLDTKAFAEWMGYAYYQQTSRTGVPGTAASDQALRTARTILMGIASHEGAELHAYLRAATCVFHGHLATDSTPIWPLIPR